MAQSGVKAKTRGKGRKPVQGHERASDNAFAVIGPQDLLRALEVEEDGLQSMHHLVRTQLQKLEAEELMLMEMIRKERRQLAKQGHLRLQQQGEAGSQVQRHVTPGLAASNLLDQTER
mmetsp:Transcript_5540/g.9629  ORF Transcript_5540/g.9629 Transcript_5540/m.9629 type:complete len:118 (+) Transcript_5540:64-417(+)|eukprot:CAMPEP_0119116606 /NCGR_PEP_ID=MMETSP1180-20130426/52381_1 /TAXON_ID=3052 ORGANISM="Chlamydomonas cf sp, Strain CCMP681" /NCGR_SAMPLE_ID=MMETSP1180 /ASSEMBLY_ACC=CAM_ASM_000741 /LENGTH=117 /DNA_ID=CAMNT_0007105777 /DNA_START=64 /DNA_END=417 /DNA_ORIENTATION=-